MPNKFLETPVKFLKGIGPQKADLLAKELNIYTLYDLINYYPFRYIDRSKFYKVSEIESDMLFVQLRGYIKKSEILGGGKSKRLVSYFSDKSGVLELIWFNGIKWIKDIFKEDVEYIVFGKPTFFNGKYNITHPEIEKASEFQSAGENNFRPVYNSNEKLKSLGLESKGISKIQHALMKMSEGKFEETLTEELLSRTKLISLEKALVNIHFPENPEILKQAENRLKFEELFYIQLKLIKDKIIRSSKSRGYKFSVVGDWFNRFYKHNLAFELTGAQKKVIKEIRQDLGSGKQMNRLLQGDVGSGKTVVALLAMLIALDNKYQSCLMAPTEILANQHFETINKMVAGLDINVKLLTGSTKPKDRKIIHDELTSGKLNILIGTHALIEENVSFDNLGLVIIDEQHRFGVNQRSRLWKKNEDPPHILVMTATPIPRTLAMTLYGDLEFSVIDELPPGRKPIKTIHATDNQRLKIFDFIRKEIHEGRQIYIVYPLINESEKLDIKHLYHGFETISKNFPSPVYQVSMIHGQMKPAEKDKEMQKFVNNETQIMVATTVIEVGVDVPNASVMIIENAERFGLSQLHQLRGRVGRGAEQSYCILMSKDKISNDAKTRIETMVKTTDGFEIAETDLKLRGPGDLSGTQQSGVLNLRIADLVKDEQIIKYARSIAIEILNDDPLLEKPQNRLFAENLEQLEQGKINWAKIS